MRRLVAALACRAGGSRLYGKPLQHIDPECRLTILEHLIEVFSSDEPIAEIVLGISAGAENTPFITIAERHGLKYIVGDPIDVLQRLIDCGITAGATDVFRVTTECPFIQTGDVLKRAWEQHSAHGNDVTATDGTPEGTNFEIYRLEALQISHRLGGPDERSERCSLYVRRHLGDFRVELAAVPDLWKRSDLRLTVDYPEDLVLCRRVYAALRPPQGGQISLDAIVPFLDAHPELRALVAPFVTRKTAWGEVQPAKLG